MTEDTKLFLGLDLSTQGLKATVIDETLTVVCEESVSFDADLSEFGTEGGALRKDDGLTVTSPPLMWVAALDLVLGKFREAAGLLARVAAISGSGQQHGSVWLAQGGRGRLRQLRGGVPLRDQLGDLFSLAESPIWMDASTGTQCSAREAALGGAQAVADITGSRAYERFTGNQIARIHETQPEAYQRTERIGLVSSFMASLLIGDYAPIDTSDGSGMNLMDIRTRDWSAEALACTAPELEGKLGTIVPGHTVVGNIHPYFRETHGFGADCVVVAFSGDNPNSLAGLRLKQSGEVALSMGTSDTFFGSSSDPRPSGEEGHVFANPVDPEAYMVMLVRQNGSLMRERVRDQSVGAAWDAFEDALRATQPGNGGHIGFYIYEPEITPPMKTTGEWRFGPDDRKTDAFTPEEDVRAVVESQFLTLRAHGERIGLVPRTILATGGASRNAEIIQVMSDVFGVPVFVGEQADSASLGAAYRALHGWRCRNEGSFVPFAQVVASAADFRKAADPDPRAQEAYSRLRSRFDDLERSIRIGDKEKDAVR